MFNLYWTLAAFSTSLATAICIFCSRCGGMQPSLGTWGLPGKSCRSDRSLESLQTAPHHSPRPVLRSLGLPGCEQRKYDLSSFSRCNLFYWIVKVKQLSTLTPTTLLYTRFIVFLTKGNRSHNRIVLESHMNDSKKTPDVMLLLKWVCCD